MSVNIKMKYMVCSDGHPYAVPAATVAWKYGCPMCLKEETAEKEAAMSRSFNENDRLVRRISALRGVIARMKNLK